MLSFSQRIKGVSQESKIHVTDSAPLKQKENPTRLTEPVQKKAGKIPALPSNLEPQELPGRTVGSVHTIDPTLTPFGHTGLTTRRRITHPVGVPTA